MGGEVRITDYDVTDGDHGGRVTEWEAGLPNVADLPPLSQFLISSELASAFSITPEPYRSMIDVDRASRDTLSTLRRPSQPHILNKINDLRSISDNDNREEAIVLEGAGDGDGDVDGDGGGGAVEEADSARASKRIRLVWTPQLHKRFVEVVAHLGVKSAVPKTIMQLMNVEGLTRENVASHLQKYRLYLKRMQGLSNEGPSPSDHLFGSTPVPNSLRDTGGASGNENGHPAVPVSVPLPYQQMVPVPYPSPQIVPGSGGRAYHNGFEYRSHPYSMVMHQMTHNRQ